MAGLVPAIHAHLALTWPIDVDGRDKPGNDNREVIVMASYDLIVIGTGPGGYVCAIRAAQLA